MASCIMEHLISTPLSLGQFLGMLVVMLGAAKAGGFLLQKVGQPAVLGELIGGIVVGRSWLGLVNPGLRDDSSDLGTGGGDPAVRHWSGDRSGAAYQGGRNLADGGRRGRGAAVCAGVRRVPAPGFPDHCVDRWPAATLTATSVGITARVLADLGRLRDPEGQIILGAAVIDDILGLMILGVVVGLTEGRRCHVLSDLHDDRRAPSAFWSSPFWSGKSCSCRCFSLGGRIELPGTATALALIAGVRAGVAGGAVRRAIDHRGIRRGPAGRARHRKSTKSSAASPRSATSSFHCSSSRRRHPSI